MKALSKLSRREQECSLLALERTVTDDLARVVDTVCRGEGLTSGDCNSNTMKQLSEGVRQGTVAITPVDHDGWEIFVPRHLLETFRRTAGANPNGA